MLLKELNRSRGALCSFILLVYFICFFGQPEKQSSKTAYLIVSVLAIFAFFINQVAYHKNPRALERLTDKHRQITIFAFAALFGLIVVYANYELFFTLPMMQRIFTILLLFISTGVVFINIFLFCVWLFAMFDIRSETPELNPRKWFIGCFAALAIFYLIIFYLCSYPGQICSDSLNQIKQVIYSDYSNHHPVYQTWLIGLFFRIGLFIFNDINDAIAVYTVFQVLVLSASFAFLISTMIEAGCRKPFAVLWLIWFMLMPCHIIFSFTLWKDSLYGAVVLLFSIALFRIVKKIGKKQVYNFVLLTLSGVGFNLLRSNGLPAYMLLLVIFAACYFYARKLEKKNPARKADPDKKTIVLCLVVALLASLIMKFPVLKAMNIPQADTVEMLSIPVQQITRIAKEKDDFTDYEREVMSHVASLETMKERYNPRIYDYARDVIRYEGDQQYIKDHPVRLFGIWLACVTRHPFIAAEAWVDQTSGYWNPGSYYWMKWWDGVCEEEGLHLIVHSDKVNTLFHSYVRAFTDENSVLGLGYNVGWHVWIMLLFIAYCIYQKRKDFMFALPVICLIGTLLIATLMHDEFRFGYNIYTCLPLIIFCCMGYKEASVKAPAKAAAKAYESDSVPVDAPVPEGDVPADAPAQKEFSFKAFFKSLREPEDPQSNLDPDLDPSEYTDKD